MLLLKISALSLLAVHELRPTYIVSKGKLISARFFLFSPFLPYFCNNLSVVEGTVLVAMETKTPFLLQVCTRHLHCRLLHIPIEPGVPHLSPWGLALEGPRDLTVSVALSEHVLFNVSTWPRKLCWGTVMPIFKEKGWNLCLWNKQRRVLKERAWVYSYG